MLPDPLLESIAERACRTRDAEVCSVSVAEHSNDVAEIRFDDGRALMVKRGRFHWAAARFANSRAASKLLRQRAAIAVPEPLDFAEGLDERPLEIYWRIDLPTLSEGWGELSPRGRDRALRSWGRLVRRVHRIPMPGWGTLSGGTRFPSLKRYLLADLGERLLPAVRSEWPSGEESVQTLLEATPEIAPRAEERGPVLVHNDLHMQNVLCEPDADGVRCVGLLDLEAAIAGAPESDIAIASVLHGPHFEQWLRGDWLDRLLEGYDEPLDPVLLRFFRAYHLANLGFFSGLVGDVEHGEKVAEATAREVDLLAAL